MQIAQKYPDTMLSTSPLKLESLGSKNEAVSALKGRVLPILATGVGLLALTGITIIMLDIVKHYRCLPPCKFDEFYNVCICRPEDAPIGFNH